MLGEPSRAFPLDDLALLGSGLFEDDVEFDLGFAGVL
jgi:hypothetical protein